VLAYEYKTRAIFIIIEVINKLIIQYGYLEGPSDSLGWLFFNLFFRTSRGSSRIGVGVGAGAGVAAGIGEDTWGKQDSQILHSVV
jgi:hypothetical protein